MRCRFGVSNMLQRDTPLFAVWDRVAADLAFLTYNGESGSLDSIVFIDCETQQRLLMAGAY